MRATGEIDIGKIESVSISQGIIGRLFNYGTITIYGTGAAAISADEIDNPLEFRKKIMEAQEDAKKG